MIDTGLTIGQLAQAAHDLRNAALVVEHAGHTTGALADTDGRVCMAGAIDLATYRRLDSRGGGHFMAPHRERYTDAECYRAEAAIRAAAEFVPTDLCPLCDDESRACPRPDTCGCQPREPWEIVTHYNDQHCTGVVAANVLRLAAEQAEAGAAAKRARLLTAVAG